jgi:hypothetical protein
MRVFAACLMNKLIFFSAESDDTFIHSFHIMYEVNTFMQDCVTLSVSPKLLKEFRLNLIMGGSIFRTHFGSFYPMEPAILRQMMLASVGLYGTERFSDVFIKANCWILYKYD